MHELENVRMEHDHTGLVINDLEPGLHAHTGLSINDLEPLAHLGFMPTQGSLLTAWSR
jgi:hypothetical protein